MSTDYSQQVADILDELDAPTHDEVYHATRAYDVNYLAAAAAAEAKAGGGGSQPFGIATATLEAADILDMDSSHSVQIAESPGAGKAFRILGIRTQVLPGSTKFACADSSRVQLGCEGQITDDSSTWETPQGPGVEGAGLVLNSNSGEDTCDWALPQGQSVFPASDVEDQALVIGNPDSHNFRYGRLLAASVTNGGSGYSAGDTIHIGEDEHSSSALGHVDTVDGGGAVLTFHITDGGLTDGSVNYHVGTTYLGTPTSGPGSGLILTATSVEVGDGGLYVAVMYAIVDVQ